MTEIRVVAPHLPPPSLLCSVARGLACPSRTGSRARRRVALSGNLHPRRLRRILGSEMSFPWGTAIAGEINVHDRLLGICPSMPQQVLPWSDSQLSKPAGYVPQEKRNWLRVLIRALSSEACTLVGAVLAADEPGESLCTKSKAREAGPWPWMVMLSPWNWTAKLISSSSLCDEGP